MLSNREVEQYRELGYLVVPDVLDAPMLAEVRRMVDGIVADAGKVATHTEVYDLENSHSSEQPRVRRIKTPHKHFPFFAELTRNPRITAILAQLLGHDIRLHGSKLNMKSRGLRRRRWNGTRTGRSIRTPTTTCSPPASCSTTATCENGPLLVVPGTHKGPIYDHHADGYFGGAMDPDDRCGLDYSQGGAADGQSRLDDHPPRARSCTARRSTPPTQPRRLLLLRVRRRRRLAADGRRQFRRVQRPGGPRRAELSSRALRRRRYACRCRRRRSRARSTRTSAPWRSASLPRRPRSTCGDRRPAGPVRPTATARCRRDVLRQCRPGGFPAR